MIDKIKNIAGNIFTGSNSKENFISEEYQAYNDFRDTLNKKYICNAPFNNLYFNVYGQATVCWLTFDQPETWSESNSIKDIWKSKKLQELRGHIKKCDLNTRCSTCKSNIDKKRYVSTLANAYDNDYPISDYPSMMEFELSNTCNLECVMCTGVLSSSIRKNREKAPALPNVYTSKFVEELEGFIPHLHEARFNGGEPFLINIYYDIWDKIIELNPNCKIVIATNGTVFNNKVKDYIEKGNFHINFSLDSLQKEHYENIRINANFDRVMENFHLFKKYCKTYNRNLCLMVCAMRNNWMELPDFVNFVNKHDVYLWLNTIYRPFHKSIWNLPSTMLQEICNHLSEDKLDKPSGKFAYIHERNIEVFENFRRDQLSTWLQKSIELEQKSIDSSNNDIQEDLTQKDIFFNKLVRFVFADTSLDANEHIKKNNFLAEQVESLVKNRRKEYNITESVYFETFNQSDFIKIITFLERGDIVGLNTYLDTQIDI